VSLNLKNHFPCKYITTFFILKIIKGYLYFFLIFLSKYRSYQLLFLTFSRENKTKQKEKKKKKTIFTVEFIEKATQFKMIESGLQRRLLHMYRNS